MTVCNYLSLSFRNLCILFSLENSLCWKFSYIRFSSYDEACYTICILIRLRHLYSVSVYIFIVNTLPYCGPLMFIIHVFCRLHVSAYCVALIPIIRRPSIYEIHFNLYQIYFVIQYINIPKAYNHLCIFTSHTPTVHLVVFVIFTLK